MCTKPYISYIKISGLSLLPPVINEKRRQELNEYKQQAIELENKLERDKLFKKCMEQLENFRPKTQTMRTLESQLTFTEELPLEVPQIQLTPQTQNRLVVETIDVTEYNGQGIKVIQDEEKPRLTRSNSYTIAVPSQVLQSIAAQEVEQKPRLMRSNSYTLASPSPILLAHLQKHSNSALEPENSQSSPPKTVIENDVVQENSSYRILETDITVQQISIKAPMRENDQILNRLNSNLIEPEILETLKHLPDECSKQIYEILKKHENNEIITNNFSDFNESSQSLYYSLSDSNGNTPKATLGELNDLTPKTSRKRLKFENFRTETDLEHYAASKIGACIKGYLTRRLMRTEKVEQLKQTIKDVLLCAIELHNSDKIDESDVELHRRLIHQLSAACYAFHDVFFTLPIREQMAIIANDRQLKIDKLNRSLSRILVKSAQNESRRPISTRSAKF